MNELLYGFFLGLVACFGSEYISSSFLTQEKRKVLGTLLFFAVGFLLARYLGFLPNFELHILAAAFVLFLLAPDAVRKDEKLGFHWIVQTLYALGLSFSISGVLLGLVAFLVWVIKELFGIELPNLVNKFGLSFFILFLVANLFSLFKPRPDEVPTLRYKISRLLEKTIGVLFTPVLFIYIAVLLAYGLKILIEFKLPQGMVSIPIAVAYGMFFLLEAYYESQEKQDQALWKYRHWIRICFVPLFIVMGIGVFKRINDYGFTPDRFYLVVIYLFMLITYVVRLKYKALEVRKLISIAALILLVTSCGPLSPSYVSVKSQTARFLQIAKKYRPSYQDLVDFNLASWSQTDINEASSALNLIHRFKSLEEVRKQGLPSNLDIEELRNRLSNLSQPQRYFDKTTSAAVNDRPCQGFSQEWSKRATAINVTGYDYFFRMETAYIDGIYSQTIPDTQDVFKISLIEKKLWVEHGKQREDILSFGPAVTEFIQNHGAGSRDHSLNIEGQNKRYKVKMTIHRIMLDCKNSDIEAALLVKALDDK